MAGRYGFSMPTPQQRDGWFRIGQVDVTTTVLVTGLGVLSMFVYAIDRTILDNGVFYSPLVRDGEVWRLLTWPLVNPPDFFMVLGLLFYWYFGRFVEEAMGRMPYTWTTVAMTIVPAAIATILDVRNEPLLGGGRWSVATFSVDLLGIAVLCVFILERPTARFMFNIPAWAVGLVIVGLRLLQGLGARSWGTLTMLLLVIIVGLFGARQRGMLDEVDVIPRFGRFAGDRSPYGQVGSARPKTKRGRGRGKRQKGGGKVVSGPWQGSGEAAASGSSGGLTPLEQAELDNLLDIIGEKGINSLTVGERARLTDLSNRLRGR